MRITLVRHGNTDANKQRWLQGQMDTHLNETGRRQAELVGKRLAEESFDMMYCSDLSRCKETLAGITEYHKDTPVTFDKRLRERDFGKLNGQPYKTISHNARHLTITDEQLIIEQGGESELDMELRVKQAYQDLTKASLEAGHEHILMVSHGGPLAAITVYITEELDYQWPVDCITGNKMSNTSVTTLRMTGCSGQIETFNCVDHLQSMLDTSLSSDLGPAV
ncbi:hypothetical protein INT43_001631 [Umbelopsis isabellina]|uniref:Phosphoglycerate mutase n=1 Tax=Mortierella isabellina TaxID=91625 RepID=A0A8H7PS61_MORIS|nr:hypothetical protein INT43_001631 [Umbelopsis isabellina]